MEAKNILYAVYVDDSNVQYFRHFFPEEYLEYISNGEISCVGAVYEKTACGVMLTSMSTDGINLNWIYVAPNYRRKGIASFLHSRVRIYADVHNLHINTVLPITSDKEEIVVFLRSLGYELEEYGARFKFCIKDIDMSAFSSNVSRNARTLQELGSINSYLRDLEKNSDLYIEVEEITEMSPILSTFIIHSDKIKGCLLMSRTSEEMIEIPFLYINGENPAQNAVYFKDMVYHSIYNAKKAGLSDDTVITTSCVVPVGAKLVRTFVKNPEETVFYRATLSFDTDTF